MEIKEAKLVEAVVAFQSLSADRQDAVIELLKTILSEREQCSAPHSSNS